MTPFLEIDEVDQLGIDLAEAELDLVDQLISRRKALGLEAKDVAVRIGVDKSVISRFENTVNGERRPNLATVRRYAEAVNAFIGYIVVPGDSYKTLQSFVRGRTSVSDTTEPSGHIDPIHPGEVLANDFLDGFHISPEALGASIDVPPNHIEEIVRGKKGIAADTAIRLARYFGTSDEFWMNLQSNYELRVQHKALEGDLAKITPLQVA